MKPACSSACLITYGTSRPKSMLSRLLSAMFFLQKERQMAQSALFHVHLKMANMIAQWCQTHARCDCCRIRFYCFFFMRTIWSSVNAISPHWPKEWLLRQFHTFPTAHGQILLSVGHFSWMHFGQKYFTWTTSLMEKNSRWWKGIPEVLSLTLVDIYHQCLMCTLLCR